MKPLNSKLTHGNAQQVTTKHNKSQQLSKPSFQTSATREKSPEPMQAERSERHDNTATSQEISLCVRNDDFNLSQQITTKSITPEMTHTSAQQNTTMTMIKRLKEYYEFSHEAEKDKMNLNKTQQLGAANS